MRCIVAAAVTQRRLLLGLYGVQIGVGQFGLLLAAPGLGVLLVHTDGTTTALGLILLGGRQQWPRLRTIASSPSGTRRPRRSCGGAGTSDDCRGTLVSTGRQAIALGFRCLQRWRTDVSAAGDV